MRQLLTLSFVALLGLAAATQAHADTCNGLSNNLVSNCSFETGTFSSWSGTATTTSSNYAGIDTGDPFTAFPTPYAGTYEAYLGNPSATIALTQTLATAVGSTYLIQFALLNDTAVSTGYTNSFAVLFDGTSIFSRSALGVGSYTLYSAIGTASTASTALSFVSRNDGGYFELDSISVTPAVTTAPTPEPSSWMLLGTGIVGCAGVARRRLFRSRS